MSRSVVAPLSSACDAQLLSIRASSRHRVGSLASRRHRVPLIMPKPARTKRKNAPASPKIIVTDTEQPRPYNNSGYLQNGANNLPSGAAPLLPNQGRVIQTGPIRVLCIADVRGEIFQLCFPTNFDHALTPGTVQATSSLSTN